MIPVEIMGTIKVVATPEAYELVMSSDSPAVRLILDEAFSFAHKGFTSEIHGQTHCYLGAERAHYFYLRFCCANSPDEDSFVIIANSHRGNVWDILDNSFPIPIR
jgi:hypothetical protein